MNKTQIIKKVVGEKLKGYGFQYLKTDGPLRIFIREVNGFKRYYDPETDIVKQYINIQGSNFYKGLTVRFNTDVYGYEMVQELTELKKYGNNGWLVYTDENDYKEKLSILTELIIEHGLNLLEKMSSEEEIIPTRAMAEKLFNQHKELRNAFVNEFHINAVYNQPKEIDESFQPIKKLMMDTVELSYENVQELLVKIAAFIGEISCEMCSYEWKFPEHFKAPEIVGDYPCFWPLDVVINIWKNKCEDQSWKLLEEHIEVLKHSLEN